MVTQKFWVDPEKGFEYIFNLTVKQMTVENVAKYERETRETREKLDYYSRSKPRDLWLADLDEFEKVYAKIY